MKTRLFIFLSISFLLCNCASHSGLTTNTNVHTTEVQLTTDNFKVVDNVEGHTRAVYVFGIGGLSKKALIAKARAKMFANADMKGKARTLINENVEVKKTVFPFVRVHKVGVSGQIIEFLSENDDMPKSVTIE